MKTLIDRWVCTFLQSWNETLHLVHTTVCFACLASDPVRAERNFGPREGVFAFGRHEKWDENKKGRRRGWGRRKKKRLPANPPQFWKTSTYWLRGLQASVPFFPLPTPSYDLLLFSPHFPRVLNTKTPSTQATVCFFVWNACAFTLQRSKTLIVVRVENELLLEGMHSNTLLMVESEKNVSN